MDPRILAALGAALVGALSALAVQWFFVDRRERADRRAGVMYEALSELYSPIDRLLSLLLVFPSHPRASTYREELCRLVATKGFLLPRHILKPIQRLELHPERCDLVALANDFDAEYLRVQQAYARARYLPVSTISEASRVDER